MGTVAWALLADDDATASTFARGMQYGVKALGHVFLLKVGAVGLGVGDGIGNGRKWLRKPNRWNDLCLHGP